MMPYRVHSPMTDPGLISTSTAGTETRTNPPTEGMGRNVQRRRDPARTHQDGGSEDTLRRQAARRAADAPTSTDHNPGQRAQTPSQHQYRNNTEHGGPTPRLRNEPNGTLNQPRRKRKQLKFASLNMNGRGSNSQDKWKSINHVMKKRQIAILGLQETHPSDEMQQSVGKRF